jgi:hypothetical protein
MTFYDPDNDSLRIETLHSFGGPRCLVMVTGGGQSVGVVLSEAQVYELRDQLQQFLDRAEFAAALKAGEPFAVKDCGFVDPPAHVVEN